MKGKLKMPNITPDQFYDYLVKNIAKYNTEVQEKVKQTTKELVDLL